MSRLSQFAALLSAFIVGVANAASYDTLPLNMPVGVTEISREVYGLHMMIFWVCVAIAVVVFGVMAYSMFAHRKSRGVTPATFHESHTVEMLWTAIPFVILVVLAVPAAKTLVAMEDSSGSELTVKVTGYQWMWRYEYIDYDIDFYSRLAPEHNAARQKGAPKESVLALENYLKDVDNPLVLPVGKKIRFYQTSNDVIHSWWVPDLALKKDAVPGFINTNWALIEKPGIYRGKCAELCGRDHGFMPIVVKAVPQEEFDAWVAAQATTKPESSAAVSAVTAVDEVAADEEEIQEAAPLESASSLDEEVPVAVPSAPAQAAVASAPTAAIMGQGKSIYDTTCAACHMADGSGGAVAPAITGSSVVTGDAATHLQTVLKGVSGTAMASFSWMGDEELAAVLSYQRNALGNSVGDSVSAADVAAAR